MFGRRWQVSVLVVLALVAWGAMPAGAASASRPGLTVGSSVVSPGGRLDVAGRGFGAVEAVDVFFDRTDVHLAVSDERGAFAGALRAPSNAIPGIHWVSAIGRRSGTTARTKVEVLGTASWPQSGYDAARSSWNPDERALTVHSVADLRTAWTRSIAPYGFVNQVVASPSTIFAEGSGGPQRYENYAPFVVAFDARTGAETWSYHPPGAWVDQMALGDDALLVATESEWTQHGTSFPAHLAALDPGSGAVRWSIDLKVLASNSVSGLAISEGTAYVTSYSSDVDGAHQKSAVWAIRVSDGSVSWRVIRKADLSGSLAVSGTTVVVPTYDGVVAFDASTGAQRWQAEKGSYPSGAIAIADGRVFLKLTATSSETGRFLALDLTTGARLWSVPAEPWQWVSGMAVAGDRLVVANAWEESTSADIVALDPSSGRTLWTSSGWTGGIVAAGEVAYSAGDGMLATYDLRTGHRVVAADAARVFGAMNGRVLVSVMGDSASVGILSLSSPAAPQAKALVADPKQEPDRGIEAHQALTNGWMPVPTDAMQGDLAITSSARFGDQTYVGTRNPSAGGGLFRMNGVALERVGRPGLGDPKNAALEPVAVGGRLYVVAENPDGLQVWSSTDGENFQLVADRGFGDPMNDTAVPFVVAGRLVLGVTNERTGLQLWVAGQDPAAPFTKVLGVPTHALDRVTGAVVFDGATYVGTAGSTHELLRTSDGISWDEVPVGAVQVSTTSVTPEATFDSELYVIAASPDGLGVLRTADGTTFTPVDQGVAPLPQDVALDGSIVVFDDALYLFASSLDPRQPLDGKILETAPEHGFRLWRSVDGSSWRGVTSPGFGDPHNVLATPLTVGGTLFVATANFEEGDSIYRSTDGLTYAPTFREASTSHTSLGITMVLDGTYLALFHGDETAGLTVWRSSAPVTTAGGSEGHLIALALIVLAVIAAAVTMFLRRGRRQPPRIVPAEGKHVATARPREPVG